MWTDGADDGGDKWKWRRYCFDVKHFLRHLFGGHWKPVGPKFTYPLSRILDQFEKSWVLEFNLNFEQWQQRSCAGYMVFSNERSEALPYSCGALWASCWRGIRCRALSHGTCSPEKSLSAFGPPIATLYSSDDVPQKRGRWPVCDRPLNSLGRVAVLARHFLPTYLLLTKSPGLHKFVMSSSEWSTRVRYVLRHEPAERADILFSHTSLIIRITRVEELMHQAVAAQLPTHT